MYNISIFGIVTMSPACLYNEYILIKKFFFKKRRITVQASPGINMRYYLKNSKAKKDWRCGSSGSVPAWQVQGLDFKLQYYTPPPPPKKLKKKRVHRIEENI
jgi:hypothetical protein